MKEQIREYWRSRPAKDRRTILLIVAIIVTALFYAYIWLPIENQTRRLRSELPKLRGEAAQMQSQSQEVARLKTSPVKSANAPPQEIINQSAEKAGIKSSITQVTALSAERIQVTLNSVSFNSWMLWTAALAAESSLRIESAQIAATGEPGMVKVQAVFASASQKR